MWALLGGQTPTYPLRVVLTSSTALFHDLRPNSVAQGYYQSSAGDDWVVVHWGRRDSERALSHEIVHASLEHTTARRPLWLEEGLAEFYSTAVWNNGRWTIGQPVEAHVLPLRQTKWLSEEEFFSAGHDSPLHDEASRAGLFYAQSWAVVHYLQTAPGIRQKVPALVEQLGDGIPFEEACQNALGISQRNLLVQARTANEQRRSPVAVIDGQEGPSPAAAPEILSEEEVSHALVSLALASGQPRVAGKLTRNAGPSLGGLLALAQGNPTEARRLFELAVAQKTASATAYFELAMLLREQREDRARYLGLLRTAVRMRPDLAEGQFVLGLASSAQGDREEAVEYFQQAVRVMPRQTTFWHALALELERSNRMAEARHAAVRCQISARNQAEREMAAALSHLVNRPTGAAAATGGDSRVVTPESWKGLQGDAHVEGMLTNFDCAATPPVIRVGKEKLVISNPGKVVIRGGEGVQHTFTCGEQNTKVRVEYLKATREVTLVEFR